MATAPPYQGIQPHDTICAQTVPPAQALPSAACVVHEGPADGLIRRFVDRHIVPGFVTCQVYTEPVVGSAGARLQCNAAATAPSAALAREVALGRAYAQWAAGVWTVDRLVSHPPEPPHGSGPGPWVRMQVADTAREVWMSATRVYHPYRLSAHRIVCDPQGVAGARDPEQAQQTAMRRQIKRRALAPMWQALARQTASGADVQPSAEGICDVVICHAYGLALAVSYQWSMAGPWFGLTGLGCGTSDEEALELARHDRAHTEAMLRLQASGEWGGAPQERLMEMDPWVHRLAWQRESASHMAVLMGRWRARARSLAAASQRAGLAWVDISPPELAPLGWHAVRALWLDGDGAGFSQPGPF